MIKKYQKYQATKDQHSCIAQSLIDTLKDVEKITLVGIKSDKGSLWDESYKNFIDDLRKGLKDKNKTRVKAYCSLNGNWHAKALFFRAQDSCVEGIIGSSNFTKPAYGSGNAQKYNVESDTFFLCPDNGSSNDRCGRLL